MWSHLRGQQGGIGFRGPGETQLEVDRRAVQRRIARLKRDLEKISRQRETRRKGRRETPTAALVGYTNVGKSTLLNALSGKEDAFVENRLFATLDARIRRVEATSGKPILLIDTVGFIRKLPHHLVASFRSTLEEAGEADVLVHVADLSHPQVEEQMEQTARVLDELGLKDKPVELVFNKVDRVQKEGVLERIRERYPDALFLSAARGLRVWELVERLETLLYVGSESIEVALRPEEMGLLDQMADPVNVRSRLWDEGWIRIVLEGPRSALESFLELAGTRVKVLEGPGGGADAAP
jgi:GTP-binding protein HflX